MKYRLEINLDDKKRYAYEIKIEKKGEKNFIFVNGVQMDIDNIIEKIPSFNIQKKKSKNYFEVETEKTSLEIGLIHLKEITAQKNNLKILGDFFKDNALIAPMPGKITTIKCSSGEEIDIGTELIVLEAMKMENSLASPVKGRIKKINVNAGDSVSVGQPLIEFE